ncbi:alcohol dehydrogenase catalytic domain-containing protein [Candidatus Bipolaricaulota bacterium]|nr:alcohol dehydrogenase catalytic domain-containing protein [Candidatus Bipolaricaulota bacterium]
MKAAVFTPDGEINLREREKPTPGEGKVRVKVKNCGVCMTDVHITHGEFSVEDPVVLGHEFSGIVDEVGPGVERFNIGDKVAANPIISCGYCSYCKDGRTNFCQNAIILGGAGRNIIDGGFQEFSVVPQRNLEKLEEHVSFRRGAFAEPLACAIRGINRLQINTGDEILLIGAGPMGLLLLQLLQMQGAAKVIVSELIDERRELALELGADYSVSPENHEVPEEVRSLSDNKDGVDVAVEAVGNKTAAQTGIESLRRGGKMLIFGVPPEEAEVPVNIFDTYFDEIDLFGSYALTKQDFFASISLINGEKLELSSLVSHRLNIDDILKAIELTEKGEGLKKQIEF